MGFNIVFAVIINSRSWIIQSCLVAVVIYLYGTTQRSIRTKVLRLLLLLLGGYIILQLLNNYFSTNLIFLSDKLGRDSRSHQYTDIAAASSFLGWLFGNGAGAVYYDSTQGYISNIDILDTLSYTPLGVRPCAQLRAYNLAGGNPVK